MYSCIKNGDPVMDSTIYTMHMLLEAGCDINIRNNIGDTAEACIRATAKKYNYCLCLSQIPAMYNHLRFKHGNIASRLIKIKWILRIRCL